MTGARMRQSDGDIEPGEPDFHCDECGVIDEDEGREGMSGAWYCGRCYAGRVENGDEDADDHGEGV